MSSPLKLTGSLLWSEFHLLRPGKRGKLDARLRGHDEGENLGHVIPAEAGIQVLQPALVHAEPADVAAVHVHQGLPLLFAHHA